MLAEPRVARDLIEGFVAPWCGDGWLEGLDLDSLALQPTESITDDRRRRLADMIWSVRLRDLDAQPSRPRSVHFLVEHQSTVDHGMALRFEEYRVLLRQRLLRLRLRGGRRLRKGEQVDAVLCVLVYDGDTTWDAPRDSADLAATVPRWIANSRYLVIDLRRDPVEHLAMSNALRWLAELARGDPRMWPRLVRRLGEWLDGEDDAGLRRAFGLWLSEINERWQTDLSFESNEEASTMIAERLAKFEAEIRAESEERGRAVGRSEGRAVGRAEGKAVGRAEGQKEGREAGLEEGIALEKAHLCRMAGRRFGAAAAERLAASLTGVSDANRLARVGDWIIDSGTAGEFIDRVSS